MQSLCQKKNKKHRKRDLLIKLFSPYQDILWFSCGNLTYPKELLLSISQNPSEIILSSLFLSRSGDEAHFQGFGTVIFWLMVPRFKLRDKLIISTTLVVHLHSNRTNTAQWGCSNNPWCSSTLSFTLQLTPEAFYRI